MKFIKLLLFCIFLPILAINWILYNKITSTRLGILYAPIGFTIGVVTDLILKGDLGGR